MEKPLNKLEVIALCLSVTAYKAARDMPSLGKSDYTIRGFAGAMVLAFWFTVVIIITDDIFHLPFLASKVLFVIIMGFEIILSIVYYKQIPFIVKDYYKYYNVFIYILFIVLIIATFCYIFNESIGGSVPEN